MGRIVRYDILRVVSSFAIVLLHVSASYWSVVDVGGNAFVVMTIYNSFTRFAVPVFFMLSGLFLVNPQRENVAVGKRFLKLLVLFYIWSAFYAFQGVAVDALHGEFVEQAWKGAVERFIFGHIHMWFVHMLLGFYLLIPVARQLCAKKEAVQYYLMLWVVFQYLIPFITKMFHFTTFQAKIDSMGMNILVGNFGYFMLGYYLSVLDIRKEIRTIIYAMGIISVGLTPFLTIRECRASNLYVETWFSPASINILIMSVAIFVLFKYSPIFDGSRVKNASLWARLSKYTFFIYMFHMFVIEKLNLIGITTVSFPAIISVPVLTVFTFSVSLLGAFIVDHIPVLKKIIMLH